MHVSVAYIHGPFGLFLPPPLFSLCVLQQPILPASCLGQQLLPAILCFHFGVGDKWCWHNGVVRSPGYIE